MSESPPFSLLLRVVGSLPVASVHEILLGAPGPVFGLGFALGTAIGVLPIVVVHAVA